MVIHGQNGPRFNLMNASEAMGGFMKSRQTLLCASCHLEISSSDLRVYQMADFHRHCFDLMIREEEETVGVSVGPETAKVTSTK
jgi:hypothetical protein